MDATDITPLLGRTELCASLSEDERRTISKLGSVDLAPEGSVLMSEGEPGGAMLLLAEGEVAIQKATRSGGARVLARLGPGTILGEVSLLEPTPRTATVKALTEVRYLQVERSRFLEELESGSPAAAKLMIALARVLAERMHALSVKVVELAERVEADEAERSEDSGLVDDLIIEIET